MRALLGAFGDPGHAFPMLALGRALRARGHEVTLQTGARWRADAEREGLRFSPAPEYPVFPTQERPLKPYEAVVRAVADTLPLLREVHPDVVVSDVLTLAPALCAELVGVPAATLIPHVDPRPAPGFAPYSLGARLPRTGAGRLLWRGLDPLVSRGLEQGRRELNDTRARLGLAPQGQPFGAISPDLALVATFPQLEYPRPGGAPPGTEVIGPLLWEPPAADVEPPPGDGPLVLVAPSTAQDAEHRLLRAALEGLGTLRGVRVLATWNRRPLVGDVRVPGNTRLVEWVSYGRTMPRCAVVVCHGGHGTVMRALASGCVVVVAPAAGDQNENAARVDWAGAGVRIPRRLVSPANVRLAVQRALTERRLASRATALARWSASHDAGARGAELVERLVERRSVRDAN